MKVAVFGATGPTGREIIRQCIERVGLFNGLAGEDWLAARFERAVGAMVWLPATHLEPGRVRLHASGSPGVLDLGPARPDHGRGIEAAEELTLLLRRAGSEASVLPDDRPLPWPARRRPARARRTIAAPWATRWRQTRRAWPGWAGPAG